MLFSSLHLCLVDKSVVILEDIAISEEMYHGKKRVTQKHHDNDDYNLLASATPAHSHGTFVAMTH